jgi:dTDP-4-dehydrorhamnose 3,5-epimerase-like enzyme
MKVDFNKSSVFNCNVFELPKISNRAGNITALNNTVDLPFEVERVYYLYDVPSGVKRGGHAHHELYQYLIAASGSFDVVIDDGKNKKTVTLNRPNFGLLITPGIWRELDNFSSGANCLVLASHKYNEKDYIREYDNFIITKSK